MVNAQITQKVILKPFSCMHRAEVNMMVCSKAMLNVARKDEVVYFVGNSN